MRIYSTSTENNKIPLVSEVKKILKWIKHKDN